MDRGIVKQAATRKMFRVDALYRVVAGIGMNVEQKNYMTYDIVDCLSRNALIIIIESRAHATCKKKKKKQERFLEEPNCFRAKAENNCRYASHLFLTSFFHSHSPTVFVANFIQRANETLQKTKLSQIRQTSATFIFNGQRKFISFSQMMTPWSNLISRIIIIIIIKK